MDFQPWRCLKRRIREPIVSIASSLMVSKSGSGVLSVGSTAVFVVMSVLRDIKVAW